MTTLDEAWGWYTHTRAMLGLVDRLAEKHWDAIDWDGTPGRDPKVARFSADDLADAAASGLRPLDDLAVLVLFSVFEAAVRDAVRAEVEREGVELRHLALRHALRETLARIDEGSFFRVLEPFKAIDPGLIEQVNQVRRYRNWVAHGRRPSRRPEQVEPRIAYLRLTQFLDLMSRHSTGLAQPTGEAPAPPASDNR